MSATFGSTFQTFISIVAQPARDTGLEGEGCVLTAIASPSAGSCSLVMVSSLADGEIGSTRAKREQLKSWEWRAEQGATGLAEALEGPSDRLRRVAI